MELVAFCNGGEARVPIVPGVRWRDWMNETPKRFANRCLPLLFANESGWTLLNPVPFRATWDGGEGQDSVTIDYADVAVSEPRLIWTNFGAGTLTWAVPYLFRTPPGFNLLVRGPPNMPRDGISPLEGVVETDWAVSTFTMNWKFTRPGHAVEFAEGDPFCMIVPQRRAELEAFEPRFRDFADDPGTAEGLRQAYDSRHRLEVEKFLAEYSEAFRDSSESWETAYFQGRYPDGSAAAEHQTKRRLQQFANPSSGN